MLLTALLTRPPGTPPTEVPLAEGAHVPTPGEISFGDVLAGLNPLQHLPLIGTIYREATGEHAPPAMRVLGGALLFGPLGMLSSAVMAALDEFRSAPPAATLAPSLATTPPERRHDTA